MDRSHDHGSNGKFSLREVPVVGFSFGECVLDLNLDYGGQGLPDHDGGNFLLDEVNVVGVPVFDGTENLEFLMDGFDAPTLVVNLDEIRCGVGGIDQTGGDDPGLGADGSSAC